MRTVWIAKKYTYYKSDREEQIGVYTSKAKAIAALKPLIKQAATGASLGNKEKAKEWFDHGGCVMVSFICDDVSYQFAAEQHKVN